MKPSVWKDFIPLVGAGFSKNAILSSGTSIPDWNQLGKEVAKYLPDYEYTNPIDALSLFESQFSRVKLIELLSKLLHIHDLTPGKAHHAFCNVFFDTICTTNLAFLRELIYPALFENEVTPITLNEVIMPGDNWMSKSETLLRESSFVIADISDSNPNVMWELKTIMAQKKPTIIICDRHLHNPAFQRLGYPILFYDVHGDNIDFMDCLTSAMEKIVEPAFQQGHNEPMRLLQKGEYTAAVISCFRQLETALRSYFRASTASQNAPLTLMQMLHMLKGTNCPQDLLAKVIDYTHIRNQVVHEAINVNKKTATDIVRNTTNLISYLNQNTYPLNEMNL